MDWIKLWPLLALPLAWLFALIAINRRESRKDIDDTYSKIDKVASALGNNIDKVREDLSDHREKIAGEYPDRAEAKDLIRAAVEPIHNDLIEVKQGIKQLINMHIENQKGK